MQEYSPCRLFDRGSTILCSAAYEPHIAHADVEENDLKINTESVDCGPLGSLSATILQVESSPWAGASRIRVWGLEFKV